MKASPVKTVKTTSSTKEAKLFNTKSILLLVATAILSAAAIFALLFALRPKGELILGENLTASESELFANNLSDLKLKSDLKISGQDAFALLEDETENGESTAILTAIYVPVTDFYSTKTSITSAEATEISKTPTADTKFIPFSELDHTVKLLAIDNQYYLSSLNSGALFHYVIISGDQEGATKARELIETSAVTPLASENLLTFAQTGVTALSRNMNTALNRLGDAKLFAANISDYLSSFDLTHTSNESSFSTAASGSNICSQPAMIDVLTSIGLDIVELTGNHNQDCGFEAARETIDLYQSLNIKTVGGGKTATEAAIPLEITDKNSKISLFAYNLSTGGYTTGDYPGANLYNETTAATEISAAKQAGNLVIVDVQYYECNNYDYETENTTCDRADSAAGDQVGFFRHLIDLGADVVVGTSAHQPQTFELYNGGAIYYGLGNLFFDQSWWPGTTRSLVLEHYISGNQLLQTRITPTVYDQSYATRLMDAESAATFIQRLAEVHP